MTTLKLFRNIFQRRPISCRFLCTEPPDNGNKNGDAEIPKEAIKEDQPKPKSRINALLQSLGKAQIFPNKFNIETVKSKPVLRKEKHRNDDPKVNEAVADLAHHIGGDFEQTKADLQEKFSQHVVSKEAMKNLLANMEVDRAPKNEPSRSQLQYESRSTDDRRQQSRPRQRHYMPDDANYDNLPGLNIFPSMEECDAELSKSNLVVWDQCQLRELQSHTVKAPKNAFEEMIHWTDSGRMRTFPVDNETVLEEEKKYTFADHIFLERHLEPWCPNVGPVRRFMHLVCIGLSKNPYIDVPRKLAHIQWYQNYFMEKDVRGILSQFLPEKHQVSKASKKLDFVDISEYAKTPYKKTRVHEFPPSKVKSKMQRRQGAYPKSNRRHKYKRIRHYLHY